MALLLDFISIIMNLMPPPPKLPLFGKAAQEEPETPEIPIPPPLGLDFPIGQWASNNTNGLRRFSYKVDELTTRS